ncbi:MAG: hypothetical protein ACFFCQ_04375 [Promethearchaeota archaeon]
MGIEDLSTFEILHGTFSLIFVVISVIIGIRILAKYNQNKQSVFITVGLFQIFLSSAWWGPAFSILSYLILTKNVKKIIYNEGINENYLGRQLDVHRRTIKRRIEKLLAEKIILPPVCRFPQVLIPPEYVLVFSLIEIKKKKDEILNTLIKDPHIPVIFKASLRKFNLVIISTYYKIEDFLEWAEEFDQRFLGCIGAVKNSYLSPGLSFSIAQNHVTLLYLRHKMNALRNRTLIELTTRC